MADLKREREIVLKVDRALSWADYLPQVAAAATAARGQSKEPGTPAKSPGWVAVAQALGSFSATAFPDQTGSWVRSSVART